MALTLGITGMDRITEAEVQAAFKAANAQLGDSWTLAGDENADYMVIDMDSLYGPMSWLRLHAAGRKVIGLTSAERKQTDYRLPRPVTAHDFAILLGEITGDTPQAASSPETTPAAPVASVPAAAAPIDPLPPVQAAPVAEIEASPAEAVTVLPIAAAAPPAPEPVAEPEPVVEFALDRPLAGWLAANGLDRRVRLQRGAGPVLLIDPRSKVWHGSATLKPLATYFDDTLQIEDFATPDAAAWESEAAALGPAQPLARLQWFGGLLGGRGSLLPDNDPNGHYRLTKWPQTEREYPKHFRIATAMMKGPATLADVAEASGVAMDEVADFVNANLATGYAEFVPPTVPESETPAQKSAGGLFGRMRGR